MEVVVDEFVKEGLILAIRQLEDAARHQPKRQEVFDQFKGSSEVTYGILRTFGVEPVSPDKIRRVVEKRGELLLVPATPAMKIVLHHGLTKVPIWRSCAHLSDSHRPSTTDSHRD
jgi:hypothetical protein